MNSRGCFQLVASLILLFASTSSCHALSCGPRADHFYLQCSDAACERAFRARQIQAGGPCMYRVAVEDVPVEMIHYLRQEIANNNPPLPKAGIYHISLRDHPSQPKAGIYDIYLRDNPRKKAPESMEDMANIFRENLREDFTLAQIRDIEPLPKAIDFDLLRQTWVEQEERDKVPVMVFYGTNAFGLLLGLTVLGYTVIRFRSGCIGVSARSEAAKYAVIQLGLFALALVSSIIDNFGAAVFAVLLLPAFAIVLIYEAVLYMGVALKRQRAEGR